MVINITINTLIEYLIESAKYRHDNKYCSSDNIVCAKWCKQTTNYE